MVTSMSTGIEQKDYFWLRAQHEKNINSEMHGSAWYIY